MQSAAERSASRRPDRILVVDDDPRLRAAVRCVLELEGFEVDEAGDGREALRSLREHPADAVLADMFMPEMDGLEFIREVRGEWSHLPVIAVSGGGAYHDGSTLRVAARLGASFVLDKPFGTRELVEVVRRALGRLEAD
jgi:DNA-binding response OmpR family regulator